MRGPALIPMGAWQRIIESFKGCWSETYYFAERGISEEESLEISKKQARLSDTRNPIGRLPWGEAQVDRGGQQKE